MRYSVEPSYRIYFKGYTFLCFKKYEQTGTRLGRNYRQMPLDTTKETATDVIKRLH